MGNQDTYMPCVAHTNFIIVGAYSAIFMIESFYVCPGYGTDYIIHQSIYIHINVTTFTMSSRCRNEHVKCIYTHTPINHKIQCLTMAYVSILEVSLHMYH